MFGFRSDGRRLWRLDPIVQFTPYIMPTRADAQNFCKQTVDYDVLANYIKKKREEGRIQKRGKTENEWRSVYDPFHLGVL